MSFFSKVGKNKILLIKLNFNNGQGTLMASLYHQDFYAGLLQNIALLKQGNWTQIDRMYLLEELEEMGANQ